MIQHSRRRPLLVGLVIIHVCCMALFPCGCEREDRDVKTTKDGRIGRHSDSASDADWFADITEAAGLTFRYDAGSKGELHMAEIMGGGVALFDYDQDGDLDIYLIDGNHRLPKMEVGTDPVNQLYRRESDGRYVDVTQASGLGDGAYGMGVAVGDIDNDGDPDVYVTNFGRDTLYRNRGNGTFEDITKDAGAGVGGWSCSAIFFDYDRDGFLDLYVTRYVEFNPLKDCYDAAGRRDYCGPKAMPPVHDVLLHNNGDGTFTDVSAPAGITTVSAAGLGVVSEDFNEDGWPDIYVANDAYANQLWINRHDGSFRDDALLMGAAYNLNGKAEAGMGVVAADLDNDLDVDLFMTHLGRETNTMYRNLGQGMGFSDATGEAGLGVSSVRFTGFGTAAFDADLNGNLDLVVLNGRVVRGSPIPGALPKPPWHIYAEPNLFYLNDGRGRFTERTDLASSICTPIEISRGLAVGDIDDDGDVDLLMSNIEGRAHLYRNDAPRSGGWLTVRAVDPRLHRDAIGARITVHAEGRSFMRTIMSGFSYLSASEPNAYFGLGKANAIERIEVRWPDGLRETFPAMKINRKVALRRGSGSASP